MDKLYERGLLFDFYGELLTPHQQHIYSEAVFNDLSLSELSEEEGISRQGISDLIRRCDKQLEGYENKLHLIEKFSKIKLDTQRLFENIKNNGSLSQEAMKMLDEGLNRILEDI